MHNKIFETHAHYDDERFDEDRDMLLESFSSHGIEHVINIAANLNSVRSSLALAEKYDYIYAAVGVHPSDISELNRETFEWLKQEANHRKVVAIGEIGLDYYWDKEKEVQQLQRKWFLEQISLANEKKLPVVIHSRDAASDTMQILKDHAVEQKGVIHCYSYSPEQAKEYVKMGYYLGIGGVITFKNAKKLKDTVEQIPVDYLLLETDSPYMAPEPNRGKRNSSLYLPYVVEAIANIKKIDPQEVIEKTNINAKKLFLKE